MSNSKKNSFYAEGTILALASIISRILGLLYRRPLNMKIGEVAYGAHSQAGTIYSNALILSTFSIPLAVAKLVSEYEREKQFASTKKLVRVAFCVSGTLGMIAMMILLLFSGKISMLLFKSEAAAIPLKYLAPTILVFSLMGVLRGLFQGKKTSKPTAVSQIAEQLVHVTVALICADLFIRLNQDKPNPSLYGAAGATFGTFCGAMVAFIFLMFLYVLYRPNLTRKAKLDTTGVEPATGTILRMLILTMIPIVLNQFFYSLSDLLDESIFNILISKRGVAETDRLIMSARYTGKYKVLTNLPISIAAAMGVAIVPSVVSAFKSTEKDQVNVKISQAIKFNMLIAIPCGWGLAALAAPILRLLLNDTNQMTATMLIIGSVSVVFFAYATTTTSILQGINKLYTPILHALIALVVYGITDYILIGHTNLSIYGLVIGNVMFPFIICILNTISIRKYTGYKQEIINSFLLPFISSGVMALIAYLLYTLVNKITHAYVIALFIAIAAGGVIYFALMLFLKAIDEEELSEFPKGNILVKLAKKLRLL